MSTGSYAESRNERTIWFVGARLRRIASYTTWSGAVWYEANRRAQAWGGSYGTTT